MGKRSRVCCKKLHSETLSAKSIWRMNLVSRLELPWSEVWKAVLWKAFWTRPKLNLIKTPHNRQQHSLFNSRCQDINEASFRNCQPRDLDMLRIGPSVTDTQQMYLLLERK